MTLRLASSRAAQGGPRAEGKARAALAELCVLQGQLTRAGKAAITGADPGLTTHWPHRVETIENSIGTG